MADQNWTSFAHNQLREAQINHTHALKEIVGQNKLLISQHGEMIDLLKAITRLMEPGASPPRIEVMKLLHPPFLWIILGLGLWAMQFPLPQIIEIMKIASGAL